MPPPFFYTVQLYTEHIEKEARMKWFWRCYTTFLICCAFLAISALSGCALQPVPQHDERLQFNGFAQPTDTLLEA